MITWLGLPDQNLENCYRFAGGKPVESAANTAADSVAERRVRSERCYY